MKKVLIILLILSITIVAYATFTGVGAGVRFVRPLHPQVNTVGLIAHYKMWDGLMTEGEIFDYTCTGKDGTLVDTDVPLTLIPTYPGFNFTPNNDYISIDDHIDFTPGGDDLVTDGDMDVPGSWTLGDGWSIAASKASCDGTQVANSNLSQGGIGSGTIGDVYRIRFTLSNRTFGAVNIQFGGVISSAYNSDDTYDVTIKTVNLGTTLNIRANSTFVGDIDDISVVPVKPFSISAWVYMRNATNFYIASKGKYNVDGEWRFGTKADNHFCCRIFDENVTNCYLGREYTTALAEDVWLHLCFTYGGGNTSASCKLYQNGVRVDNANHQASATSFITVQASGHDVWLCRNPDNYYANGIIDDVMFFNKELSIIEVRNIYEVTRWRYSR